VTLVAIHQPVFLPWLGWWDKLVRADRFVLLDDVQFPKKGGTWMNRVRMLVQGEPAWVTVPVDRSYHGVRSIREMRIDERKPWRESVVDTIARSYRSAAHFEEVLPLVQDLVGVRTDRIAELNESAIRRLAEALELDTSKFVRQSELGVDGAGTDLLVELCRSVGGTAYLSGDGAAGYLEPEKFPAAGLDLVLQGFEPPAYPQLADEHVPGLSVVDTLMNCGRVRTLDLLAPRG
jgi:WbqC-like protein family